MDRAECCWGVAIRDIVKNNNQKKKKPENKKISKNKSQH